MIDNLTQYIGLCSVLTIGIADVAFAQAAQHATTALPNPTPTQRRLIEEFEQSYALRGGQVIKHFAPPFHPGRVIRFRHTHATSQVDSAPEGPDNFFFRWSTVQGLQGGGEGYGVPTLKIVLTSLVDVGKQDIDGDGLLDSPIRGDWVVREGVPDEQVLPQLERILNRELKLPVRLTLQNVTREVIVAKGDFHLTPIGDSNRIEVYG
jgi:hypothetical protein